MKNPVTTIAVSIIAVLIISVIVSKNAAVPQAITNIGNLFASIVKQAVGG